MFSTSCIFCTHICNKDWVFECSFLFQIFVFSSISWFIFILFSSISFFVTFVFFFLFFFYFVFLSLSSPTYAHPKLILNDYYSSISTPNAQNYLREMIYKYFILNTLLTLLIYFYLSINHHKSYHTYIFFPL